MQNATVQLALAPLPGVPPERWDGGRYALPISKLRGLTPQARAALKQRRVTTCSQLLRAAGGSRERAAFAREAGLPEALLLDLVRRADMARVNGVGTVFGMMLEELGVADVGALAAQRPGELHERLRLYNQEERIARRSPTPAEVEEWVGQARALDPLVGHYRPGEALLPSPSTSAIP